MPIKHVEAYVAVATANKLVASCFVRLFPLDSQNSHDTDDGMRLKNIQSQCLKRLAPQGSLADANGGKQELEYVVGTPQFHLKNDETRT